ncbi:MAG: hypothetical protein A2902_03340 [Elusimicrobia bacterium RIFCSPLOWO2_01_FULL_64_13]|nr:MAG: hypothetical protein A2902_03340 [Elusimicrobia bacterium RIFCSPLOWO2_01_FULL_64_13]
MLEEKIPVQICGQTYEIIGNPAEALRYTSLARFVESKMKEIQASTKIVSTQKIAVLAALNVVDELFRERETKSFAGKSVEGRHEELIRELRGVLEEPEAPRREPAPPPGPARTDPAEELLLT